MSLNNMELLALETEISKKLAAYFSKHGKFPTRIFLDRERYMKAIMTPCFSQELNKAKTFLGMELYQCSRIFGEKPVLELLE